LSPIWILPIISLIVGGWLLSKSIQQEGIDITLNVDSAAGITVGKTRVLFKGIPVGLVEGIGVSDDLKSVTLNIEMDKKTAKRLVDDTTFWVVEPEVSISKIEGLETLLTGNYIGVHPGESTTEKRHFTALFKAPVIFDDAEGLHLVLTTDQSSVHNAGAPILYKKIMVGEVKDVHLNKDNDIQLEILIYDAYTHLINQSTLFWDFSGMEIEANLPKIKFKMGTLASLFSGGIAFTTPAKGNKLSSKEFTLYEDHEKALQADYLPVTFHMLSRNAVEEGAEVKYRNNKIGTVTQVILGKDFKSLTAKALIAKNAEKLLRANSYFWIVRPQVSLSGIQNLDAALSGTYLEIIPGKGKPATKFIVHDDPPAYIPGTSGLELVLTADTLGSIKRGNPVNYRQVKVGHVTGHKLSEDRHKVLIHINIHKEFTNLISENTKFWNTSG
ncbi:MAG: MCE family protein, partial [Deltaproteobacteria bacterium]|nr:MCE family protein [Deltaproteobacteria bacterium]